MIICALNVCGSMAVELAEKEKSIRAAAEKGKTMLRLHQAQIAQRSQPVVSNDRPVSGPEAGDGSDNELAPEEAPRVLPQATVNKLETAEIPPVSLESGTWIITSPLTGGHQDASIERTRRKDDPVPGPESEKAAEPEPPVQPLDEWGLPSKKNKKRKIAKPEPGPEPVPEPVPELAPEPETSKELLDDWWGRCHIEEEEEYRLEAARHSRARARGSRRAVVRGGPRAGTDIEGTRVALCRLGAAHQKIEEGQEEGEECQATGRRAGTCAGRGR